MCSAICVSASADIFTVDDLRIVSRKSNLLRQIRNICALWSNSVVIHVRYGAEILNCFLI